MRTLIFVLMLFPVLCLAQNIVGQWDFDNSNDLLNATVGNDLELVGTQSVATGPSATDGAVNIGVGSYYKANHGIPVNGGGTMVNEYTLVIDFKVDMLGRWYCFEQTNYQNSNDGDAFINTNGQIGVGVTGYSAYTVIPGEWYRLAIAVDLGSGYKYYLDGQLLQDGGVQTLDGRFSLYPANPAQPLLLFADENGEDNPINVAYCAVYDGCLTATQVGVLGGYGHQISAPSAEMLPYLQTPSPTSMYVCWHAASADESRVEYGTTNVLGSSQTGTVYAFNSTTKWHSVKLLNLQPNTQYYYRCYTAAQNSPVNSFRTPPAVGSRTGHFRFLIMGDSQSNYGVSSAIVYQVVAKLTELYGADWQNSVQLLCHVGDTVGSGAVLSYYTSEHFIPFAPLSARIPTMVAIGNHEAENDYYYHYRAYEDVGGPEGEKYYSFDLGAMRFLFLNPNIATSTETPWLQSKVTEAQSDADLDWIFAFSHMPAYSEIWPDGNNTWAQNTILPTLAASQKGALLAGGHSHNYERGLTSTGRVTTLICGGAGGTLDRWGMYANQQDYPNTLKAIDNYHWILVDVDLWQRSYHATMYSLGTPELIRNNEIMDEWGFDGDFPGLVLPLALAESACTGGQMRLVGGLDSNMPVLGTRFQVSTDSSFTTNLLDLTRYNTNVYGDTGSPAWQPIDLNAGLELFRCTLPNGTLTEGNSYYWRIQVRNQDLEWTLWSQPKSFVMQFQPVAADFVINTPITFIPLETRFYETSIGEASSWAWDFASDGIIDSSERDPVWFFHQQGTYNVTLAVIINGQSYSVTKQVEAIIVANQDDVNPVPDLKLNIYPNPCQQYANIVYSTAKTKPAEISIYNVKGEIVRRFTSQELANETGSVNWDGKTDIGTNASAGIYLVRLKEGTDTFSRKLVLIK